MAPTARPATPDEIAEMGRIVADAVRAGALGFTTSRTLNHRTSKGDLTPTLTAAEEELVGIAEAMGDTGAGVIELISDFPDGLAEFDRLRHMVERSGRPLTVSLAQAGSADGYKGMLALLESAAADDLPIRAQVATRPIGVLFGLQATYSAFSMNPVYREIADLPFDERLAALLEPEPARAPARRRGRPRTPVASPASTSWATRPTTSSRRSGRSPAAPSPRVAPRPSWPTTPWSPTGAPGSSTSRSPTTSTATSPPSSR